MLIERLGNSKHSSRAARQIKITSTSPYNVFSSRQIRRQFVILYNRQRGSKEHIRLVRPQSLISIYILYSICKPNRILLVSKHISKCSLKPNKGTRKIILFRHANLHQQCLDRTLLLVKNLNADRDSIINSASNIQSSIIYPRRTITKESKGQIIQTLCSNKHPLLVHHSELSYIPCYIELKLNPCILKTLNMNNLLSKLCCPNLLGYLFDRNPKLLPLNLRRPLFPIWYLARAHIRPKIRPHVLFSRRGFILFLLLRLQLHNDVVLG